ncbi:MAG: DegT/DnrJ/EryC1/StrS family aminotransferase [Ruminococcus flavefaciens]|nr:DegT/DnrJ/EryC1/StrS family aminotransferase [Ruminococcus flavefaciens]
MKKIERIGEKEKEYVLEVLNGGFASKSSYQMVTRLEQKFAEKFNRKYAVAMVNGTATLHAALEAAGVGEGDEVICPPLTMSSTSLAVVHANAIPVFADVDQKTFLITADTIKEKITKRTKAVITVSVYGLSPDMDEIMALAKENNLIVIEDDAECFLAKYKNRIVGTMGDMASFSFQSSKHMTAGEGGIVITDDAELALKLRRYSGLGYGSIGLEKGRITKDDIQNPMYERHIVLGWNYRPSDLVGAVALAQLERLEELVEMRQIAAGHFLKALEGCDWLVPQYVPENCENSYWAFSALLDTEQVPWEVFRKKFMELGGDGIYAAWKLSYMEPAFRNMAFLGREKYIQQYGAYEYKEGLCPVAEYLQPRILQFKTDYWNEEDAVRQAEILKQTIHFFK